MHRRRSNNPAPRHPRCPSGIILGLLCVAWLLPAVSAGAQGPDTEAGRRAAMERMIAEIREDYPDVPTITAAELREALREGGIVLVDVRTRGEREVSTLPGAISADDFDARLQEFAGRTLVAYCTIGLRSSDYVRKMRRRGVDIVNLEGSVLAWTHAGGELYARGERTDRLHVYGRRWNLAADGYRTVWNPQP